MKSAAVALCTLVLACSNKSSKQAPAADPAPAADAGPAAALTAAAPPERIIAAITSYDPRVLDQLQAAMGACKLVAADPHPRYLGAVRGAVTAALPPMDPGHGVRAACADALGAVGGEGAADALLVIVANPDEPLPVTSGAMSGLARLGEARAAEPIVRAMLRSANLLDAGRSALAHLRAAAIPILIATLGGERAGDAAPGTVAFAAARALGDLRAAEAVPALVAALGTAPQPAMVSRKGDEAGPTHHVAVIEALRKIGGAAAAAALADYWKTSDEPALRTQALDAYGFVAPAATESRRLGAIFADGKADTNVRIGAGLAYARVGRGAAELAALKKHAAGFRTDAGARRLYLVTAGLIARAWVGAQCKGQVACAREILARDPADLSGAIAADVPGGDELEPGQRAELANAARERALIDLRIAGKAEAQESILALVGADNRLVHQAALDAMFAVSTLPCEPCARALTAALAAPADGAPVRGQMRFDSELAHALVASPAPKLE